MLLVAPRMQWPFVRSVWRSCSPWRISRPRSPPTRTATRLSIQQYSILQPVRGFSSTVAGDTTTRRRARRHFDESLAVILTRAKRPKAEKKKKKKTEKTKKADKKVA